MDNLEAWSFLWEQPEDFLIVKNSETFPNDQSGLIFYRKTRYCLGIENDNLYAALVQRMLQAGVESVESREFRPEPTEATKIIEQGIDEGLPREEINKRLKSLQIELDRDETTQRIRAARAKTQGEQNGNPGQWPCT